MAAEPGTDRRSRTGLFGTSLIAARLIGASLIAAGRTRHASRALTLPSIMSCSTSTVSGRKST